jgi:hypothetical protein
MTDAAVNINTPLLQHSSFDLKAWMNSVLPAVAATGDAGDDLRVSKLLTRLQVHHQEASASLEDLISQALVRLPRTALEVERLTSDTVQLSKQLSAVVESVEPRIAALPAQAKDIARLDLARAKLLRCSHFLQRAKMVTLQLEELEVTAKAGSGGGAAVEGFANAISEIQDTLRDLQRIDPSYGADIQARVHSLENDVQKSVERECLELLRRQDRVRAPALLSTLRKIGREGAVMDEFVALAAKQRKEQFLSDLRASAAGGAKPATELVAVLASNYKGIAKIITREAGYIGELFDNDPQTAADVAKKIGRAFAEPGIASLLTSRLRQLQSNADLVQCIGTVQELKNQQSGALIEHAQEDAFATFAPLVPTFLQREADQLMTGAPDSPQSFAQYFETLEDSVSRCTSFLPAITLGAHLPVVLAALRDRLSSLAAPTGSLQERLQHYGVLCGLRGHLGAYEASFLARLPHVASAGKLSPSVVANIEALVGSLRAALVKSIDSSERSVGDALLVPVALRMRTYEQWDLWSSSAPSAASKRPYASFSSGEVSPSDIMRSVCEALMEVPLMLEAVNVDAAEMQLWLTRVVDASVASLSATLAAITIRGPSAFVVHALDQLATDVEYYHNVLNAVSEGPFEIVSATREVLRREHQKWSAAAPTTEALKVAVGDLLQSNMLASATPPA